MAKVKKKRRRKEEEERATNGGMGDGRAKRRVPLCSGGM